MEATLSNVANDTVNPYFKEQFITISLNFAEYSRELLGAFFAYVYDHVLNIKPKTSI